MSVQDLEHFGHVLKKEHAEQMREFADKRAPMWAVDTIVEALKEKADRHDMAAGSLRETIEQAENKHSYDINVIGRAFRDHLRERDNCRNIARALEGPAS